VFQDRRLVEMMFTYIGNALCGIGGFHRLGVIIELTINETLAIANHPYFTSACAIDGSAACEALFRMFENEVWTIMMGFIDSGKR
jgi:hypothetical protein